MVTIHVQEQLPEFLLGQYFTNSDEHLKVSAVVALETPSVTAEKTLLMYLEDGTLFELRITQQDPAKYNHL